MLNENPPESDEVAEKGWRMAQANRLLRFCAERGVDYDELREGRAQLDLGPIYDEHGQIVPETIDWEMAVGVTYLDRIPQAADIPSGLVLAHNNVRPARRLGSRGFRAWLQLGTPSLVACECGWAPEAGAHYRIERSPAG